MRKLVWTFTALTLAAALFPGRAAAGPVPASAQVDFQGGVGGDWAIQNTSSPGIQITQVKINLAQNKGPSTGNLFFDTVGSGSIPFAALSGAVVTGFASVSGNTDGSITLTLDFNDFDPGELFRFEIDVDSTLPSGTLGALARSIVTGAEMAGSTVDITFGGANVIPATLSGTFVDRGDYDARANVSGTVEVVPEPTSLALLGVGLTGIVVWRRRRVA